MKVGETFTFERSCNPSTGVYTVPVRLTNLALLGVDVIKGDFQNLGRPDIHRYTVQFIASGKAEIQFAHYCIHDFKEGSLVYDDVISFNVESGSATNDEHGGWSDFEELTEEDLKQFEKVMSGYVGATYTPSKVSKKIANGIICRYACIGRLATLGRETFQAIVEIYYPASGEKPTVEIKKVLL